VARSSGDVVTAVNSSGRVSCKAVKAASKHGKMDGNIPVGAKRVYPSAVVKSSATAGEERARLSKVAYGPVSNASMTVLWRLARK
jgi:hypothetical protein